MEREHGHTTRTACAIASSGIDQHIKARDYSNTRVPTRSTTTATTRVFGRDQTTPMLVVSVTTRDIARQMPVQTAPFVFLLSSTTIKLTSRQQRYWLRHSRLRWPFSLIPSPWSFIASFSSTFFKMSNFEFSGPIPVDGASAEQVAALLRATFGANIPIFHGTLGQANPDIQLSTRSCCNLLPVHDD